jgi:hypothetical protein
MKQSYEAFLDGRELRRFKQEERAVSRLDRQMEKADRLIGELCREGKPVFYVVRSNGKIREDANRYALVDFLVRNGYV